MWRFALALSRQSADRRGFQPAARTVRGAFTRCGSAASGSVGVAAGPASRSSLRLKLRSALGQGAAVFHVLRVRPNQALQRTGRVSGSTVRSWNQARRQFGRPLNTPLLGAFKRPAMRHLFTFSLGVLLVLVAGCSSTPRFESRSHALENPEVEEVLIKKLASEEFDRLGSRGVEAVKARGGHLEAVKLVGDVAVVTTTSRGHSSIERALEASRRDMHGVASGT